MKLIKLRPQANLFIFVKILFVLGLYTLILTPIPGFGQIYISDHFDRQSDWNGCSDPPAPWGGYFYNPRKACNRLKIDDAWDDAHGSIGKSVRIAWSAAMMELGMDAPQAGGKSSLYIGFWWRHDPGWNWGRDDTHKWIYFPKIDGRRTMISFNNSAICFFDGYSYSLCTTNHPNANRPAWLNDASWHSYIVYVSPADKKIRLWYDGDELKWNGNNLNVDFGGNSFDSGGGGGSRLVFGFQSRPRWGSGNVSYFDDIIAAGKKEEVEAFLGIGDGSSGRQVK